MDIKMVDIEMDMKIHLSNRKKNLCSPERLIVWYVSGFIQKTMYLIALLCYGLMTKQLILLQSEPALSG